MATTTTTTTILLKVLFLVHRIGYSRYVLVNCSVKNFPSEKNAPYFCSSSSSLVRKILPKAGSVFFGLEVVIISSFPSGTSAAAERDSHTAGWDHDWGRGNKKKKTLQVFSSGSRQVGFVCLLCWLRAEKKKECLAGNWQRLKQKMISPNIAWCGFNLGKLTKSASFSESSCNHQ